MDPVKTTIESYNKIAKDYCRETEKKGDREFQEKMIDKTLEYLPTHPRIIDLGCGDGRDSNYFHKNGADIVGIDLSQSMIDLARNKYPNIGFFRSDIRETIFPDNTFHGVWASASLINLPKSELNKLESEIYRIIKNDGIFAFSFKKGQGEGFEENIIEGYPRYFSYYTIDELERELKLFDIVTIKEYPEEIFNSKFIYCWATIKKQKQNPK